jgi:hypothetical protein
MMDFSSQGEPRMQIAALGYVGIRSADLDQWATYGTRFLGMQLVDKSRDTLALRMDDRKQRVSSKATKVRGLLSTAGRSRTRLRSRRWRRIWKNQASRLRAVRVRSPTSAASRT